MVAFSPKALGQISVRVKYLQIISGGNSDAVGKDDEVQAAGMFGGGILDPGDAARIISEPRQQLRGRMRGRCPGAGHFLRGGAERGQGCGVSQIQQVVQDSVLRGS